MNTQGLLITYALLALAISYGTGFMFGGHKNGMKVVMWELKQAKRLIFWAARKILETLGDLFHWTARQCAGSKKK